METYLIVDCTNVSTTWGTLDHEGIRALYQCLIYLFWVFDFGGWYDQVVKDTTKTQFVRQGERCSLDARAHLLSFALWWGALHANCLSFASVTPPTASRWAALLVCKGRWVLATSVLNPAVWYHKPRAQPESLSLREGKNRARNLLANKNWRISKFSNWFITLK